MKKISLLYFIVSVLCLSPTNASATVSFFNTADELEYLSRYTGSVKLTVSIKSDPQSDSFETIGWSTLARLPQKAVALTVLESLIPSLHEKIRNYLYPEGVDSDKRGNALIILKISNNDDSDPIVSSSLIEARF